MSGFKSILRVLWVLQRVTKLTFPDTGYFVGTRLIIIQEAPLKTTMVRVCTLKMHTLRVGMDLIKTIMDTQEVTYTLEQTLLPVLLPVYFSMMLMVPGIMVRGQRSSYLIKSTLRNYTSINGAQPMT